MFDLIKRSSWLTCAALLTGAVALAGCHQATPAERAAAPIVEKNAEARGGRAAWRAVEAMAMSGRLDAGTPKDEVKLAEAYLRQQRETRPKLRKALAAARKAEPAKPVEVPFVLELRRPLRSRVEIEYQGQTAVQVFDGSQGWKLRPFLGRREVERFSAEELRVASQQSGLDGPLLDHAARGSQIELEGTEPIEGRDTYRLKITSKDGAVRHVWVDAKSYLDVRVDEQRRLDGRPRSVFTTFRDYRAVGGLMIPHLLETTVEGVPGSEKIQVEHVTLNPKLDDSRFARPG